MTYHRVGILCHPLQPAARELAESLRDGVLGSARDTWLAETGDEATMLANMPDTELLVCIGGDGTMLWAARAAVPHPAPIIGINMGHLGFLSELEPTHAREQLQRVLDGDGEIDERAMLECRVRTAPGNEHLPSVALNDVVVGRAAVGRPVYLSVRVDGEHLATVRADAMIVATATGSTAYSLSAGGPVLLPRAADLLLTPVAPHLSRMRPIVIPPGSTIDIEVQTDLTAIVSIDGQLDLPVSGGGVVSCRVSEHKARFVRLGPPSDFFHKLAQHLNLSTRQGGL